jgi:hypothetical protein
MKHRSCAEAQGDGVPCLSVRVACDECVRARPLHRRIRRRRKIEESKRDASVPSASPATARDPTAR